jgi:hypothetical protein
MSHPSPDEAVDEKAYACAIYPRREIGFFESGNRKTDECHRCQRNSEYL